MNPVWIGIFAYLLLGAIISYAMHQDVDLQPHEYIAVLLGWLPLILFFLIFVVLLRDLRKRLRRH